MRPDEAPDTRGLVNELTKLVREQLDAEYPIRDVRHLLQSVQGGGTSVKYEGAVREVGILAGIFSEDYFPIQSPEDLVTKAAHLQQLMRPGWPGALGRGRELREPPSSDPKTPPSELVRLRLSFNGTPTTVGYHET